MATDGHVGPWHSAHLGALATGAPGMIMVEATGVTPQGRISIGCPSIEDDAHAMSFKPMIDFAHSLNVKMGIQLAHAGRKASTMRPWDDHRMASTQEGGWQAVSSSATAFEGYPIPRELTTDEIKVITEHFATAAARAVKVGFDVIEIHAAHGYLMHQFYSPLMNHRTDEYGGSFENRIRFLLETTQAVRNAIPQTTPLLVRISATDWADNGWNLIDSIELCTQLKSLGVDQVPSVIGPDRCQTKLPSPLRLSHPHRSQHPHSRSRPHHRTRTSRTHHRHRRSRCSLLSACNAPQSTMGTYGFRETQSPN